MNGYQRRKFNNVLYTKELGGRVTPPATVASGLGADPKGHGLGGWDRVSDHTAGIECSYYLTSHATKAASAIARGGGC